jgi:hypothetical protein
MLAEYISLTIMALALLDTDHYEGSFETLTSLSLTDTGSGVDNGEQKDRFMGDRGWYPQRRSQPDSYIVKMDRID